MSEMEKKSTAPDKSWLQRAAESEFFHNYKRSPSAIIGTVIVVLVLFIALCGPLFAPQNSAYRPGYPTNWLDNLSAVYGFLPNIPHLDRPL